MHRLFLFKAFQLFLVTYPCTVVPETLIDNVKLIFFYLSVLWNYYAYTYSFFDNISPTVCEKNGHPLLGLSSKVFTFDHLLGHRSDFFNNLTIFFFTEWPEDHKYRCPRSSTNSVGLHFHEGVEKIKENDTNTKKRKPTNWAGKVWREKSRAFVQLGQKLKKIIISSNFSLKLS